MKARVCTTCARVLFFHELRVGPTFRTPSSIHALEACPCGGLVSRVRR